MNPFKKEKLTCKNNLNEKGGKYFHVKLSSLKLYPFPLTHLCLVSHKRDISKQCRPDQMPQNAASDQGLHCLH